MQTHIFRIQSTSSLIKTPFKTHTASFDTNILNKTSLSAPKFTRNSFQTDLNPTTYFTKSISMAMLIQFAFQSKTSPCAKHVRCSTITPFISFTTGCLLSCKSKHSQAPSCQCFAIRDHGIVRHSIDCLRNFRNRFCDSPSHNLQIGSTLSGNESAERNIRCGGTLK